MLTLVFRQMLIASIAVVTLSAATYGADGRVCNFSQPSSLYEQNPDFVRVLNQFANVLDLVGKEVEDLSKSLVHVTDVSAPYLYYDPNISRRYHSGYICERQGLSSLTYEPGDRYPSDYSFCFITKDGTLDEGEIYVETNLFLPRKKWVNYLDFPNREGLYGTFLRTTRLGARIRFTGVSGHYYLKHGGRYFSVRLSIVAKNNKTTVRVGVSDSTKFVRKQIDCENK